MCDDPPAASAGESTDEVAQATIKNLPGLVGAAGDVMLPYEQKRLATSQATTPGWNQLAADMYRQYGPDLATTGAKVENINRMGAANTDLDIIRGPGGALVKEGQALDKQLNPEYYATRTAAGDKLGQLLNSINLDNANPEAERLVNQESNRTGNINTGGSTSTVSNALSFGDQMQKRRDSLGSALGTATNFLSQAQGSFNPIQTALNRSSGNTGDNKFAGNEKPGDQGLNAMNNLQNNVTGLKTQENDINSNRRDLLDRVNETMSSMPT